MAGKKHAAHSPGRPKTTMSLPRSKRYLELMDGTLAVEDLDDEEIFRGQLRGANGTFTGRPPDMIPRALHQALASELRKRMQAKFERAAEEAVDIIIEVMREGEGEQFSQFEKAGTKRLEAAKYIVERVMGPIPKANEVAPPETAWQRAMGSGELIIDIEPEDDDAHLITRAPERRKPVRRKAIEGEVVE